MQRSVALVPINPERKILLQHRTKDAPTYPDRWGFFGGRIEKGEAPEDAVVRETEEELGIVLRSPVFLGGVIDPGDDTERFFFRADIDMGEDILRAQQKEGDNLKLFSLEEIKNIPVMTEGRWRLLLSIFNS